jgi:hypothetical protein
MFVASIACVVLDIQFWQSLMRAAKGLAVASEPVQVPASACLLGDQCKLWQDGAMARRKPKRFRAVEAVKAMARERIGTPPAARVIPDRKKTKKQKHRPKLEDLLDEM